MVQLTPECQAAVDSGATGVAFVSVNEANGRITYSVLAFNLPGTLTAAHIHGPIGSTIPVRIAVPLVLSGANSGGVAAGTATNTTVATQINDNPESFYFNLHTSTCPGGALRGSIG